MSDAGKRPTRPALSREFILRTALALVDRDGLDALTMRRLGAELRVDPMAVYRYVPGKGELLDGIAEILWRDGLGIEELADAAPDADWRELLARAMSGFRDELSRHPRAVPIVATHPLVTTEQYEFLERGLELLEPHGFEPGPLTVALLDVLASFTIGHVLAEVAEPAGGAGGEFDPAELAAHAERFPRVVRLLGTVDAAAFDGGWQFGLGLRAILNGWHS
ncbi:TetR/AcrR family transcriptional regulator [Microbacterium sp.]|uniref:TetR/AcrR family transcriptional regulator n=1 Tax=Microbacterium sp. TaxID=51671 RepID=UPI003C74A0F3